MNREMSHEEAFTALDAVALDALDAPERDAVLAHAEHCPICRVELGQLRETAAHLAFTSPLAADTATHSRSRIHSRLMARTSADVPQPTVARPAAAPRRFGWLAAAAGILFVASASMLALSYRQRDSLRAELMSRDSVIAGLTGKDVAMMTLTSAGPNAPFAHMFWDHAQNTWTLVAHNMPDLEPGRTYQLWLVTPTAKISAGTFESKNGEAMVRATYPLTPDQLMALAVTEEPMGGMPQPTGAPIMAMQAH